LLSVGRGAPLPASFRFAGTPLLQNWPIILHTPAGLPRGGAILLQNNSSSEEDDQIAIAWQAPLEMAHADPLRMRLCIFIIKARNRHLEDNKPGPDRPIKKLDQTA
jgi:hypothetical protein